LKNGSQKEEGKEAEEPRVLYALCAKNAQTSTSED